MNKQATTKLLDRIHDRAVTESLRHERSASTIEEAMLDAVLMALEYVRGEPALEGVGAKALASPAASTETRTMPYKTES